MKYLRLLLLALCLPASAFAFDINVTITYSAGAASRATAAGVTIQDRARACLDAGNPNSATAVYAASGINAVLTTFASAPIGKAPPPDSADWDTHFRYAHNAPYVWSNRAVMNAGVSIHMIDKAGTGEYMQPRTGNRGQDFNNSVAVVSYDGGCAELEKAVSKIMGAGDGYSDRRRSLVNDPLSGANYCYHTREAAASDPSMSVPFLAYWTAFLAGTPASEISDTYASLPAQSCSAYLQWWITKNGGSPLTYASATYTAPNCQIFNSTGGFQVASQISLIASSGSAVILPAFCGEVAIPLYSKNGNLAASPFYPQGDSGHDSVSSMNTKISNDIIAYKLWNQGRANVLQGVVPSLCRIAVLQGLCPW